MQNENRKYNGETSDGVPCSFMYSFLAFRSNLTVKIVSPRVPDNSKPSTTSVVVDNAVQWRRSVIQKQRVPAGSFFQVMENFSFWRPLIKPLWLIF